MSLRQSFDDALGRRIIDFNIWALDEGLQGTVTRALFDAFCQRLVAVGFPLWRGYAAGRTLHPQWIGYGYHWRRDLNAIEPLQFKHGSDENPDYRDSPFSHLVKNALGGTGDPWLRRRLQGPEAKRDFPVLEEFAAQGGTDYVAALYSFGDGDPSQGTGVVYSFATTRSGGFNDDDLTLLDGVLPALSLAIKSNVGHEISAPTPDAGSTPARCTAARSRACAPSCGSPISAASRRSRMRCRATTSSICSTTSSRR
jgi:adenylate cyclase